jgi:hypothetical protein
MGEKKTQHNLSLKGCLNDMQKIAILCKIIHNITHPAHDQWVENSYGYAWNSEVQGKCIYTSACAKP